MQQGMTKLCVTQSTTDKLMSSGDQNKHQHIQRSAYPFENVNIKKAWGSGRESITAIKSSYQSSILHRQWISAMSSTKTMTSRPPSDHA